MQESRVLAVIKSQYALGKLFTNVQDLFCPYGHIINAVKMGK